MAGPTEDDIKKLQEQIDDLNTKIEQMSNDMDKIDKSSSNISKHIGDSNDLLSDAVLSVRNISTEFRKFATDSQAQYKFAEGLAKASKSTAVNIGISVGRSQEFTKAYNRATAEVNKFGGTTQHVSDIMEEMVENSGRARIISPEEVGNIFKVSKALGMTEDSVAEMAERMDLMGVSSEQFYDHMNDMTIESQKLGLNSKKVATELQNNFGTMSRMSFKNGVKGMTEMAKLAVKMRMDVSDMLGMAEKFYEPEQAIEAVANLQMLGGDVAEAFGDPFETMYLARNKPEELAKKVQQMAENMMQFNEETGEYEFPAEVQMQLKSAGEQLGLNTDSMIDMARQASKIKDIKMNVSGNITDEDMREGLAGMAKMKDGKWVVDFKGEELDIGDIGMDKAAEILSAPKDSDDAIMDIAYNSMTTNEILENILEAMKTGYVAEQNVYEITEDILRPGMRALFEGVEGQVQNVIEALKDSDIGKIRELMLEQARNLGLDTAEKITQVFEMDLSEDLMDLLEDLNLKQSMEEILEKLKVVSGEDVNQVPQDDFILRSSGQVTSFTNQDDLIGAKKGGPLDKLMDKALPSGGYSGTPSKLEFGDLNITGKIEIVSNGNIKELDMTNIKPQIEKMIIGHMNGTFRNGGVASSKEATDYMG